MVSLETTKWTAGLFLFFIPHINKMILQDEYQTSTFYVCMYFYKQQYDLCSPDPLLDKWSSLSSTLLSAKFRRRRFASGLTELYNESGMASLAERSLLQRIAVSNLQHSYYQLSSSVLAIMNLNQVTLLREREREEEGKKARKTRIFIINFSANEIVIVSPGSHWTDDFSSFYSCHTDKVYPCLLLLLLGEDC